MMWNRSVKPPPETDAWLHTIVRALENRGLSVVFGGSSETPVPVEVEVQLRTAWIDTIQMEKTVTVVMAMNGRTAFGQTLNQTDQVSLVHLNWTGARREISGFSTRP